MTTVVLNTTTRKVEVFSSARDVQARADIADHQAAANPHPQYLGQADAADVATSGNAADVVYAAPGTGAVLRAAAGVFGEAVRITDYGGVGDDSTDNTAAAANAKAAAGANRPIVLNNGDYNASQTGKLGNMSGTFTDALGTQWLLGTSAAPATRHEPILWVEKVSSADRDVYSAAVDHSFYVSLEKTAGDAAGDAITGYVQTTGGPATVIGVHGRARVTTGTGTVFGLWGYADLSGLASTANGKVRGIACELDVKNATGEDFGWQESIQTDSLVGLIVATADGTNPGTAQFGINFTKHTGEGFYTGINFHRDAILSDTLSTNAEVIRVRGGSSAARQYTAINLYDGYLRTGINFAGPTYDNDVAIVMPQNGRMSFGTDTSATLHFYNSAADSAFYMARSDSLARLKVARLHGHGNNAAVGILEFQGWNASNAERDFAEISGYCINDTAGGETGEMRLSTRVTGTETQQMAARNGVTVGAPTGNFKGTGAVNAETGYYNNNIPWLTGTGTPEGAVTAPVGAMYSRTDGGASTTFYVKESGTGNTGWIAK